MTEWGLAAIAFGVWMIYIKVAECLECLRSIKGMAETEFFRQQAARNGRNLE